jgi:hypothetical protein
VGVSIRADEWCEFAQAVVDHIELYTVPQYGDKGADLCSDYTVEKCVDQAKKYLARHGRNSRPGQDKQDLLKAAHYLQMAWRELSHG